MAEYSIDEILAPLALTVIIDNKVRDPEMNEFENQAQGLLDLLGYGAGTDSIQPKAWFVKNETALRAAIEGKGKNTVILKALTRFSDDDAVIEAMYDAILVISISDNEYHESESQLVRSAASIWGFSRPPFKVVNKGSTSKSKTKR